MKQYDLRNPSTEASRCGLGPMLSGYLSEFDICTGKVPGERDFGLGLGGNVVKRLTRNITGRHYIVYCDNFFTSATLFDDLLKDKIYACRTYNHTRTCYPKSLKTHAKSGFKTRGKYKYRQRGNLYRCGKTQRQCLACQPTCPPLKLQSTDVRRMVVE